MNRRGDVTGLVTGRGLIILTDMKLALDNRLEHLGSVERSFSSESEQGLAELPSPSNKSFIIISSTLKY